MADMRIQSMEHEYNPDSLAFRGISICLQLDLFITLLHLEVYETVLFKFMSSLRIRLSEFLLLLCIIDSRFFYLRLQFTVMAV